MRELSKDIIMEHLPWAKAFAQNFSNDLLVLANNTIRAINNALLNEYLIKISQFTANFKKTAFLASRSREEREKILESHQKQIEERTK